MDDKRSRLVRRAALLLAALPLTGCALIGVTASVDAESKGFAGSEAAYLDRLGVDGVTDAGMGHTTLDSFVQLGYGICAAHANGVTEAAIVQTAVEVGYVRDEAEDLYVAATGELC